MLPKSIQKCISGTEKIKHLFVADPCQERDNYGQSVMAIDMNSGQVRWVESLGPINAFTASCLALGASKTSAINCPKNPGPDYDFGQAPILKRHIPYKFGGEKRDQIYVGQKSGQAYAFDAETGYLIWTTVGGPGSAVGGMEFGSSADDDYFYVGNNNADLKQYTLPNERKTRAPSWSSISLKTGKIRWTTTDPQGLNGSAFAPLTIWDQLVLVQGGTQPLSIRMQGDSNFTRGCLYGLRKDDGHMLYEKCIDNKIGGGASVVDKIIYLGSGYQLTTSSGGLYALELP
ncbi:unnamed protein product [Didymodactylos carnosus]|uniref:Pyrrolo-quinoline quinone repeat domain-containing protein n=1 Tax=Didymodactylos carnosus TaxID=1234261 RepID=A0A8S2EI54_9BILA|nr:unnamed protein product [Didymodactylos carnosus]CAF3964852.1 unnamed protein product [Didymodactylos carnosus]